MFKQHSSHRITVHLRYDLLGISVSLALHYILTVILWLNSIITDTVAPLAALDQGVWQSGRLLPGHCADVLRELLSASAPDMGMPMHFSLNWQAGDMACSGLGAKARSPNLPIDYAWRCLGVPVRASAS